MDKEQYRKENIDIFNSIIQLKELDDLNGNLMKGAIILRFIERWCKTIITGLANSNDLDTTELFNESYLIISGNIDRIRVSDTIKPRKDNISKSDYVSFDGQYDCFDYNLYQEHKNGRVVLPANYNLIYLLRKNIERDLIRYINKSNGKKWAIINGKQKQVPFEVVMDTAIFYDLSDPYDQYMAIENKQIWTKLSAELNNNEKYVYEQYSYGNTTYEAIGKELKISKQGAHCSYLSAIIKLKKAWKELNYYNS